MRRWLGFVLVLGLASVPAGAQTGLFDANRTTLYTQEELWKGFDANLNAPAWDAMVYDGYVREGKYNPSAEVARSRSLHDDGITTALMQYAHQQERQGRKLVGVMGNANEALRCTSSYRQTALLGYKLARAGYLVATGGGPGEMEAANLGAYLSSQPEDSIDQAITLLRARAEKSADASVCRYKDHNEYSLAAMDVVARFPHGEDSLGIPTWFYGHEPPNRFALHVAKYFSNAIREDILLSLTTGGTVFVEGSAGMRQEIYQKAAQNHFASFCYVSPMVFVGTSAFGRTGIFAQVSKFASATFRASGSYQSMLQLTDNVDAAVKFIARHPATRVDDAGGACSNQP